MHSTHHLHCPHHCVCGETLSFIIIIIDTIIIHRLLARFFPRHTNRRYVRRQQRIRRVTICPKYNSLFSSISFSFLRIIIYLYTDPPPASLHSANSDYAAMPFPSNKQNINIINIIIIVCNVFSRFYFDMLI